MTAQEAEPPARKRSLLHWLGLGSAPDTGEPPPETATPEAANVLREQVHWQLLDDIRRFIVAHRLDVSPFTLAIAHDFLTGADPQLVRAIEERLRIREPVTQEWLEQTSVAGGSNEVAMLQALMGRLEQSLEEFGSTTRAAHTATREYNSALEQHVGELEQVSKAGVVISELASIAKVMLRRTREIEKEMTRSEMQTRSLRHSLEQARRTAECDHLTGLPNRRAFDTMLAREYREAAGAGEQLCVAFCDIDHFKRVNDTHGHEAGDRVLRAVAQALSQLSGKKCHVARHGGEEFVILLRGKTLPEAWETLDAARQDMASRRLVNRSTDVPFGQVTFSGGLADVFAHDNARAALKAADEALYAAKARGRNRIVMAEGGALSAAA